MTSQTFRFSERKAIALPSVRKVAQSATFKNRVLVICLVMMTTVSVYAQQPTPEAFLNCVAEMKRIDAMFPDSIQPKYQMALQSLYFSVMNPHAPQTDNLLAEAEQTIMKMDLMKNADPSDVCTLRGFLYMVRIVQNPEQNGQRYYLDVMENYEKALKLNPDNQLAQQLQQQFLEGMRQQTGTTPQ